MSPRNAENYLDHNASAPLCAEALEAVVAALRAGPGNAGSAHAAGRRMRRILGDAREHVAALVGARAQDIVFTSGTTESNALAIGGALAARPRGERRLVHSHAEHESLRALAESLAGAGEASVDVAEVDTHGRVDADAVERLAAGDIPAVVVLSLVQSVTGAVLPVARVRAATPGATLLVDAAQAVGRVAVDVATSGVDLLSFSAHKIGGPQGVGALFVRQGTRLATTGAEHAQERGRRAGTEAVALAAGFAAAARVAAQHLGDAAARWERALRPLDDFVAGDARGLRVSPGDGCPNLRLVRFIGCDGATLLAALDARGIRVSTGTACASGARTPPHVLVAGGHDARAAAECVRVSIGHETTPEDLQHLVDALRHVLPTVRGADSV